MYSCTTPFELASTRYNMVIPTFFPDSRNFLNACFVYVFNSCEMFCLSRIFHYLEEEISHGGVTNIQCIEINNGIYLNIVNYNYYKTFLFYK